MTNATKVTKTNIESEKLFFEGLKHLTTINTGTIVILSAFLEKDISNFFMKLMIVGSLFLFLLSLIICLFGMFIIGSRIETGKFYDTVQNSVGASFGFFIIGTIILVIFFAVKVFV